MFIFMHLQDFPTYEIIVRWFKIYQMAMEVKIQI